MQYISQLIRYSRACGSYQDILYRELLLTRKLLDKGFLLVELKSQLQKCYGRHHDLIDCCRISVSQMTTNIFHCRKHFSFLSSFMTYYWACNQVNTMGVTSGAGTAYPSGAPEFTRFLVGFVLLDLQSYVYVLQTVVYPFVLFLLAIVLSVLFRYTDSDYPFGIFKLFFVYLRQAYMTLFECWVSCLPKRSLSNFVQRHRNKKLFNRLLSTYWFIMNTDADKIPQIQLGLFLIL